jgi:ABC-type multidrug transport system ATPase subunit
VIPGVGGLTVGSPLFPKTTITLAGGKQLVIDAPNASATTPYVKSLQLDGKPIERTWLNWNELSGGGTLKFDLGSQPTTWAQSYRPPSFQHGQDAGIGYLTEDRKGEGLAMQLSVEQNVTLAHVPGPGIWIDRRAEHAIAEKRREELDIRTPSLRRAVESLSGGTQQKVVVAKWLQTEARVLFFDEPTRGIDVGAKAEIFKLMGELAGQGQAIVLISSYLPELTNMCDRIVVMRDGQTVGELTREEFDEERIMALASGMERTVA